MRIDCDIEADGLINYLLRDPYPKNVWCIGAKDIDTGQKYGFVPAWYMAGFTDEELQDKYEGIEIHPLNNFKDWSEQVTEWWGHNFLSYDRVVLNRLLGTDIKPEQVYDTLIYSKMIEVNRKGGHSLRNLGNMLQCPKDEWDDWTKFSEGQFIYCMQDVETSGVIREWAVFETRYYTPRSLRLEHDVRNVLDQQQINGFYLDERKAQELYAKCKEEADTIAEEIESYFKPRPIYEKAIIPRAKKDGNIAANSVGGLPIEACTVGAEFSRFKWKPFSIASHQEKTIRLEGWWKPYVKTKTGKGWQICEENLATLHEDAPEGLKKLARWAILNSRHKTIYTPTSEAGWLSNIGWDGRVHGYVDGLGAYTGRCGHSKPNTANIPSIYDRQGNIALYGREMRQCWTVKDKEKYCIVGTDASGIQLRVLAHYINNDDYSRSITEGNAEDETDIHNVNKRALGDLCKERAVAKTFIYAWLLGAKAGKVASILSTTQRKAKEAVKNFQTSITGLDELLYRKSAAARRGYMVGLDGRHVPIPSDHHALSVYLQNGEAVIMKLAMVMWNKWATAAGIDYRQCSFVHDEWQTECEVDRAEELGKLQVKAIVKAGELLNMNIALDGMTNIGEDWSETH